MADRSIGVHATTTPTTVYTGAENARGTRFTLATACNYTGTDQTISISWIDASTTEEYELVHAVTVKAGDSIDLLAGGFILGEDDELVVSASANNAIDVTFSIMED